MIGEVAAFDIDDLVKELRCMAARDMGSDEWKKCMELREKFFDEFSKPNDVCERCEYHHDGSPCGYDPGNPYDLCSLAADEIETLRGRAEQAEAALKAAEDDIRELLIYGASCQYERSNVCTLCAEYRICSGSCEEKARWRGVSAPCEHDKLGCDEMEK